MAGASDVAVPVVRVYGRHAPHFLGHSPKTVAGKHYVAPFQSNFDETLDWLRGQLFS